MESSWCSFCVVIKTDFILAENTSYSFVQFFCSRNSMYSPALPNSNYFELTLGATVYKANAYSHRHTHTLLHMCLAAGRTQTPAAPSWSEKDKQWRTREKRRAVCLPRKKGSKWKNACTNFISSYSTNSMHADTHSHWMRNGKCIANDSIISELAMLL